MFSGKQLKEILENFKEKPDVGTLLLALQGTIEFEEELPEKFVGSDQAYMVLLMANGVGRLFRISNTISTSTFLSSLTCFIDIKKQLKEILENLKEKPDVGTLLLASDPETYALALQGTIEFEEEFAEKFGGSGRPVKRWIFLFCNSKAENSFTHDPDSFNGTSSKPQFETYLCELCGNDSHYGYDCPPQFPFFYEQEPSYNQNYNDNYYPHDSSSFLCCDNCGGSHETFQCQPMDQNIDSSDFDQIQPSQYLVIHHPSQEMSEEVFQAKENLMKSIQTFLVKFNRISFGEMPKIINEELAEYINSPSWNRLTFYNDDEEYSIQYKEYLENSSNAIAASYFNQEKEEPPQNFDIFQLIREECGIKVCEEQKQNMEDTMLELLEVCRQKELYCMHNDVDNLIESAFNSKLLSINLRSQRLDKKRQEVKNIVEQPTKRGTRITESLQNFRVIHKKSSISLNNTSQISLVNAIAPVLPTEEPEYSLSMGHEHLNTIPETESDKVIKSSVEKLVPILSECEVTSNNESECDVPVCKDFSNVLEDHSEILSDSNNDDISSDDDAFEDIEYVEASLPDSELVSLKEENDVYQEEKEIDLEDILQIQDIILREKLLSINRLIADIEFLNDNPTPERVLKSSASFPIFEKSDNSLSYSDNFLPEFETFSDHTEETRSDNSIPPGIENFDHDSEGDIHFLEELLSDDSLPLPKNESSNFDHHDDPSFPRPPPELSDVEFFFDFEPDSGELISAVTSSIDELNEDECFDPGGGEIDVFENVEDDDYFSFVFVIQNFLPYLIYPEDSPLLLSTRSEDTIFDPGIFT
uniref:Vacuolar protein sorting-associated protein 53 A-like n=1 Tax=Tanacetum cinerariifolium TaxID=118510 RepID=A0A6L2K8N3_TANCI|nr:vacuolar protein sorting-associated protein 53 A-like [Tanacetum cinerariifolium]